VNFTRGALLKKEAIVKFSFSDITSYVPLQIKFMASDSEIKL
jgi:hypothetical protein